MQATPIPGQPTRRILPARSMAVPVPRPAQRLLSLLVSLLFWAMTAAYAVGFSMIALRQYDTFVPHALDLGNMAQAFWNTVHGHPFKFQNMRAHVGIEAFGTDTRLSFHVEPLIPFLSIIYFFYQHVQTLLVMQTVAIATGAIPARLLARRHLANPLAELVFPLAYLLFPALEAANLYEFHPVAFAAPLLLWAFYFADGRRYTLFAICAFAAMGTKEEIGLLVALMGVWIAVRHGERQLGAIIGVLGVAWTFIALKEVVPHFNLGDSSYWGRYIDPSYLHGQVITQSDVIHFWLHQPKMVWDNVTDEAKRSYLHRLLYPAGYLALFSPLTLLAAVPGLALILLSYEPHMYGGLAHYSAELVPVVIVSSILGAEWVCAGLARYARLPLAWVTTAICLYVLIASVANQRVNGFTPMAQDYYYPPITAHDRLLDTALAMIPPGAAVSAQDNLNAHLSDREQVFLYPDRDFDRVQYVIIDATEPVGSVLRPCDLTVQIQGNAEACDIAYGAVQSASHYSVINHNALLLNGKYTIKFAQDGILLLQRYHKGMQLNTTLPPSFWTFMEPPTSDVPSGGPIARFGNYLELEGYKVDRAERSNLRNPDVVLTTWWRVLKPMPLPTRLVHYLTDPTGALRVFWDDDQATDWQTLDQWVPGRIYKMQSFQLTVTTNTSGKIGVDLGLTTGDQGYDVHHTDVTQDQPVTLLPGHGDSMVVGNGKILQVAGIQARL
ncbi:MAG TPA: DUF2079 domain-containing protein [Chloroflexota bacterium]|nr:DUF2079 domain-containing protein [Chloroflexota bacterium]